MSELILSPVAAPTLGDGGSPSVTEGDRARNRAFEWSVLGLYGLLLGVFASRHSCGFDEIQAWLIARDSNSLASLFHHLRYEGHPALWYLFLYIPAHVSWNPVSMQAINYVFAVAWAWLILSPANCTGLSGCLLSFLIMAFTNTAFCPETTCSRCCCSQPPRAVWWGSGNTENWPSYCSHFPSTRTFLQFPSLQLSSFRCSVSRN